MSLPPVTATARDATGRLGSALEIVWIIVLILPAVTTLPPSPIWDLGECALLLAPIWLAVAAHLVLPRRWFVVATLPLAVLGLLCVGAMVLRGVDALELALQWRTFSRGEVDAALRPYLAPALAGFVVIAALCAAVWRWAPARSTSRRGRWATAAVTLAAALAVPHASWLRTWPIKPALVLAAAAGDSRWVADRLFPQASTANPRNPKSTWNASRLPNAPATETIVFVIGETVRNDFFHECHGPARVRPVAAGALVACDVTAGADATVTSVPLLISREMPGHPDRVSADATFAHALKEAGFDTYWHGTQGPVIAWADADHQSFPNATGSDSALLLPPLQASLAQPAPLKAVVSTRTTHTIPTATASTFGTRPTRSTARGSTNRGTRPT